MIALRNFMSAFLTLLLLTQCNTKQADDSLTQIFTSSGKSQSDSTPAGEWKYSNSIWYSSELTLHDNGTFKFHDQGCYGQRFSQGQWINNNGIIQLTSFDTFNQQEKTATSKANKAVVHKIPKGKKKNGLAEFLIADFENTTQLVLPGPNDTIRIYLNKVQLRLKNETLYCIGSVKLPEAAKFYRSSNKL